MARPRRYSFRPNETRSPTSLVVIFCDDTRAAPTYFGQVRRLLEGKVRLQVFPAPKHGIAPKKLVEFAHTTIEDQFSEYLKANPDESEFSAWVLLDRESSHDQQRLTDQAAAMVHFPLRAIRSQPCFELWVLAHFIAIGGAFSDCSSVIGKLRQLVEHNTEIKRTSKKGHWDFEWVTRVHLNQAVENARTQSASNGQSWTEIVQLMEHLLSHLDSAP